MGLVSFGCSLDLLVSLSLSLYVYVCALHSGVAGGNTDVLHLSSIVLYILVKYTVRFGRNY